MEPKILRLNMAGQPIEWLTWKECVSLYAREIVVWSLGGIVRRAHGGKSRISGLQTYIDLPAIVACDGEKIAPVRQDPPLTNTGLFNRDNHQCLYCGNYFLFSELSRDHVFPSSKGGQDRWENVVAACKRCNQHKGDSLLEDINMELIALPYRPNPYEYLALINSARIRSDQMEYLSPQFSRYKAHSVGLKGNSYSLRI